MNTAVFIGGHSAFGSSPPSAVLRARGGKVQGFDS